MKNVTKHSFLWMKNIFKKTNRLLMRLVALTLFLSLSLSLANPGMAQKKLTLDYEATSLLLIVEELKKETGYKFFYDTEEINLNQKTSISVIDQPLITVLETLFNPKGIDFKIIEKQIVLTKLKRTTAQKTTQVREVKGTVKDDEGSPLPGANILVKGTTTGTQTDFDGNFTIELPDNTNTLVISYIGFKTVELDVAGQNFVDISLESAAAQLDDVVIVGSRNPNRTATETSVPVDVIDVTAIASQGPQVSVNQILNYVAPSFTSQSQTVSDGTDHIDPASLRGLGPNQVLVLINGKRRHNTALINVNGTVGAGSVGTDMNAIPAAAIQRIEVLRDGAAAQYGSDAIAGVINIVLKKNIGELSLMVTTGANFSENSNQFEGGSDGEKFQVDANYGLGIGDSGYINFTGSLSTREPALRNKDYAGDIFQGFHGAERIFAAGGGTVANMGLQDYADAA